MRSFNVLWLRFAGTCLPLSIFFIFFVSCISMTIAAPSQSFQTTFSNVRHDSSLVHSSTINSTSSSPSSTLSSSPSSSSSSSDAASLLDMQPDSRRRLRRKNRRPLTLFERFPFLMSSNQPANSNSIETFEQLNASLQQHQIRLLQQLNETLHIVNSPTSTTLTKNGTSTDYQQLLTRLQSQLQLLRQLQQLIELPQNESSALLSSDSSALFDVAVAGPLSPSSSVNTSSDPSVVTSGKAFFQHLSQTALNSLTVSDQISLNSFDSLSSSSDSLSSRSKPNVASLQHLSVETAPNSRPKQQSAPPTHLVGSFPTLKAQQSSMSSMSSSSSSSSNDCSVRPLLQTLREVDCAPKTVQINYCYGRCSSFYLPAVPEPITAQTNATDASLAETWPVESDETLGEPIDLAQDNPHVQFRSCPTCKPAQSRWLHVRLHCPTLNPPFKVRRVQLIQKCQCQT